MVALYIHPGTDDADVFAPAPDVTVQPLAGELVGRGDSAAARGPVREVLGVARLRPAGDGGAPQACPEPKRRVVSVDVGDAGSGAHGHPLAVGVVVRGGEALRAADRNLTVKFPLCRVRIHGS